jgi:hypothetical protein
MTTNHTNQTNQTPDASEILESLRITKVQRRTSCGGAWVLGTIAGHRFDALVFPEHAQQPDFELDDSRISKLWLKQLDNRATVANFDRGWDVRPETAMAQTIVDLLAAGLAETIYAK